ncbi:hypothetical protein JCM10207_004168 [Rhodosporidiobolus poonsookiae]
MASRLLKGKPARLAGRPAPPSAVALGTAYELSSLNFLKSMPYGMTRLLRVGGASDQGVDLRGRWAGAPLLSPSSPTAVQAFPRPSGPVVVQCKAYADKLQPVVFRELEGVVAASTATSVSFSPSSSRTRPSSSSQHAARPAIGFLLSLSGFTTETLTRAHASRVPLALLHLEPNEPGALVEAARRRGGGALKPDEMRLVSAGYNSALRAVVAAAQRGPDGED